MINSNEEQGRSSSANDLEDNTPAGKEDSYSRVQIIKLGHERSIRLLLVVENFRLAFYLTFLFISLLGFILTVSFVDEDYDALIIDVIGISSICVYFDFPPSTYVIPSIYTISLLFIHSYAIVSMFRAWVAMEEGKISRASFIGYVIGFLYVLLSFVIFITSFAVQPDPENLSVTMRVHTGPYLNLMVGFWVIAVLVTWFGDKVAWRDLDVPRALFVINWIAVACQSIVTSVVIILTINGLGDVEHGLWYDPATSPKINMIYRVCAKLFLVSVILFPTLQSAYLSYKGHTTHCVYLSLEDNREARTKSMRRKSYL